MDTSYSYVLSTSYNNIQAEILYKGGDATVCSLTRDNIRKAQDQEDWIKKLKDGKEFQKNITTADVAKESFMFKRLWHELPNLELRSDKILHRKGDENNQVILPNRTKPLVFKELHSDLGHLGYDQTLELIKERFFWPKCMMVLSILLPKFVNASKTKCKTLYHRHHSRPLHLFNPQSLLS